MSQDQVKTKIEEMSQEKADMTKLQRCTDEMKMLQRQVTQMQDNCGEFLWCIDNWEDKLVRCHKGIYKFICSDHFFSHRNGYKMRLWLEFDNPHLYLDLQILRGKNSTTFCSGHSGTRSNWIWWIKKPIGLMTAGLLKPREIQMLKDGRNQPMRNSTFILVLCQICPIIQPCPNVTTSGSGPYQKSIHRFALMSWLTLLTFSSSLQFPWQF